MDKELKDILLQKMQERKIRVPKLSELTGIPKDRIYKWFQQGTNPKHSDRQVLEKWINGEKIENVPYGTFSEAEQPSYLEQRRQQKNNTQLKYTAPFFPIKAQAGYIRARDQEMYVDTLERYALPPGVNPQGAIWRYWEVEGSSMEPTFRSGDIILTAQVHQFDWENLKNFYVYVIVTNEVILIKRIFCKNDLEWVLISENEDEYPQQLLPVEFVKEVWIFRRKIESKAPPIKMFEIKV